METGLARTGGRTYDFGRHRVITAILFWQQAGIGNYPATQLASRLNNTGYTGK
jgi:hypothetical protein